MNDQTKIKIGVIALALLFLAAIIILPLASAPNTPGPNYKNVTVTTHVNISNSKPEILNVTVYDAANSSLANFTVSAGGTKTIYCNATIRDWNGFNDIVNVSAVLYHVVNSTSNASDDFNTHYTNSSCTLNGSLSNFTGWYVCAFDIIYYANNGTWNCNISAQDTYNKTGNGNKTTVFSQVYALNVTDGLDYGNVAVEDFSTPDKIANITNLGNMPINISVEGYGVTRTDGLAMNCSINGNITVDNERFAITSGVAYSSKTSLTSTLGGVVVPGLTLPKQRNSTTITNSTYWQLYIPPNPAGNCTGFIIFTALAS